VTRGRRAAAALLAAVALGSFLFAWIVAGRVLHPPWLADRSPEDVLVPDLAIPYEDVAFPGPEGSTLRGWFVPAETPVGRAVVGLHGGGGDRRSWLSLTPALHAAGYPVLLYDARGHGASDGEPSFLTWRDLVRALDWLEQERGIGRAAVLGSSLGAANAIVGASLDPRIDAVVAQSSATGVGDLLRGVPQLSGVPGPLLALSARLVLLRSGAPLATVLTAHPTPEDLIGRIAPRGVLLIHGSEDDLVPVAHVERLYAAAREPKALWIVPGGGHRGLRGFAPDGYRARVLAFLARYAPPRVYPGGSE
jgi:pimeloyl-ACP methyl ester carboxylesterase